MSKIFQICGKQRFDGHLAGRSGTVSESFDSIEELVFSQWGLAARLLRRAPCGGAEYVAGERVHSAVTRSPLHRLLAILALASLLAPPAGGAARVESLESSVKTPVYRLTARPTLPAEKLRYALHWVGIPLGGVEIVTAPVDDGAGLSVAARGSTVPAIEWLYSLHFSAEGRVRTEPFAPGGLTLESCENDRHKRTRVLFPDGEGPIRGIREKKGRVKEYVFHSENSYDVPSAVYLMLHLDYAPGRHFELDAFTGEARYLVSAEVRALERIDVAGESVEAWHLRLATRDLSEPDSENKHRGTSVWISAQAPRRLLRARTDTYVGPVSLELLPEQADAAAIDASCPTPRA